MFLNTVFLITFAIGFDAGFRDSQFIRNLWFNLASIVGTAIRCLCPPRTYLLPLLSVEGRAPVSRCAFVTKYGHLCCFLNKALTASPEVEQAFPLTFGLLPSAGYFLSPMPLAFLLQAAFFQQWLLDTPQLPCQYYLSSALYPITERQTRIQQQ
jgi:hypothetical protein